MPPYDTSFHPPAPIAVVEIGHPVTPATRLTLPGKLDSGADLTVIPEHAVEALRLRPQGRIWTRGYDGTATRHLVYYVHFALDGIVFPLVRCLATDRAAVLVGRNVLNSCIVVLDGPSLTFSVKATN